MNGHWGLIGQLSNGKHLAQLYINISSILSHGDYIAEVFTPIKLSTNQKKISWLELNPVELIMCPYILLITFYFSGICGSPRVVDIGGVPYLMPVPDKSKVLMVQSFKVHSLLE